MSEHIVESAKQPNLSNTIPNSKKIQEHHKFGILRIKDKIIIPVLRLHQSKSQLKIHESTASILNTESTLTRIKQLTNRFNYDPNKTRFGKSIIGLNGFIAYYRLSNNE